MENGAEGNLHLLWDGQEKGTKDEEEAEALPDFFPQLGRDFQGPSEGAGGLIPEKRGIGVLPEFPTSQ